MFTDAFLAQLPSQPEDVLAAVCQEYQRLLDTQKQPNASPTPTESFLDAYAALSVFSAAAGVDRKFPDLTPHERPVIVALVNRAYGEVTSEIRQRLQKRNQSQHFESSLGKYRALLRTGFAYEFTDGDLQRVQTLLNQLRDIVTASELFTAEHQRRILMKLEKLQSELHKRMGSLDRFWGMVGEAGVAIGKFGNDAKPFVDCVRQIAQIIWSAQATAEQLPSGTLMPLLTSAPKENPPPPPAA